MNAYSLLLHGNWRVNRPQVLGHTLRVPNLYCLRSYILDLQARPGSLEMEVPGGIYRHSIYWTATGTKPRVRVKL